MLEISNEVKTLLAENYRQIIEVQFANGSDTITLTEKDIIQNSFKWDRYCATGEMLEIGSAASAEIEFTLRNNGYFYNTAGEKVPVENISFEGKELTVKIGVAKWGAKRWENATEHWFNIGKFTILSMPHKFATINISALDRMTWFDFYTTDESISFSRLETLQTLAEKICFGLGIECVFDSTLPNANMEVDTTVLLSGDEKITYRQIIQWIAALTGTCAYIDVDGKLRFRWLKTAEGISLTPNNRYSSTVYESVMFSGLTVEQNDESYHTGADGYYNFQIINNSLLQGSLNSEKNINAITNLWNVLGENLEPYRPFEASTVPLLFLEPLDVVEYRDNDGSVFNTLITHVTYTMNGAHSLKAVGISETEAQIATPGGQTVQEAADIKDLKNRIAMLENSAAAARASLTEMVKLALGLHQINVTDESGTYYYFTTAKIAAENPTLADLNDVIMPNDVVYLMSGAGLSWCYGSDWVWDSEQQRPDPNWRYGITREGTAILSVVNTEGITVSNESVYRTQITPGSYNVYQGANLVFGFNGQLESQINRLLVKSNIENPELENNAYIRLGSAMLVPADGGLDIVYVEDI